jgi:hypothetical protein
MPEQGPPHADCFKRFRQSAANLARHRKPWYSAETDNGFRSPLQIITK